MKWLALVCVLLTLLVVALIIANMWARRTASYFSPLTAGKAREAVRGAFGGRLWVDVDGPGDINVRRRALRTAGRSTISADVEPEGTGSRVDVWVSQHRRWLELADCSVVIRAQRRVGREVGG